MTATMAVDGRLIIEVTRLRILAKLTATDRPNCHNFYLLPLTAGEDLAYETAKRPQAEVLEVNQSPVASRLTSGTKWASKSATECSAAMMRSDSTACEQKSNHFRPKLDTWIFILFHLQTSTCCLKLIPTSSLISSLQNKSFLTLSLTMVSSTVARDSKGGRRQ